MFLQTRPVDRLIARLGDSRGLGADRRIAVCGTHRSGTTLLGSFLTADSRSRQIFEPFNPVFGIEDATYSFIAGDVADAQWHAVIDRFLAADGVRFRRPPVDHNRFGRWLKGTRAAREFAAARLFRPRRLVFKCPFMSLSSQYLIDRHGIQVVFTIKHPAAFFASLRRVGWHEALPLDDMVAQGVIDAATRDAATTAAARAGLFWSVVNAHALETYRRFPGATAFWSHEHFCRAPDSEMERVMAALHIDYSSAMRRAVAQATQGAIVEPDGNTVHALVRDSSAMADSWRGRISPEEEAELRTRCGALYEEIVGTGW
ncbi:hypothetical protein U1839_04030 [Sphingomonas sp. RT2P30]|uniref:hypothetical protein n=1 Tax=Parasphingomonas halimpatiens TaxID=3096162 RepID=UPI002FC86BD4